MDSEGSAGDDSAVPSVLALVAQDDVDDGDGDDFASDGGSVDVEDTIDAEERAAGASLAQERAQELQALEAEQEM